VVPFEAGPPRPQQYLGYNQGVPAPQRPPDPPVIAALKELRESQPDLAPAANLQIELFQIRRRTGARAPLPAIAAVTARQERLTRGEHVLSFGDFRFEWSDIRLSLREVARAMEAAGALGADDAATIGSLVRGETPALERCISKWFSGEPLDDTTREVIDAAMVPFVSRAASAALTGLDLSAWQRSSCPACGAESDFAVIARDGKRHLSCHRCRTQWPWHAWACPRCSNDSQATISSFASRDGYYRIYACGKCGRYVKAFDCRTAPRPFLPEVDLIATLPLDAAAIGKGFQS
jgi:formate dehydrogenase maturation protein FdhE